MRGLFSYQPKTDFGTLNKPRPFAASSHDESGNFFASTHAKHLFVGSLLWLSLTALALTSWVGAWSLAVRFSHWMGH